MRLKQIFSDKFTIAATMEGDACPVVEFLTSDDVSAESARAGFLVMLQHLAEHGWNNCPVSWSHEANKQHGIYEFIKGNFRIFFFKGDKELVAVCTSVKRKSGQKADTASVNKAKDMKKKYWAAVQAQTIQIKGIDDEDA